MNKQERERLTVNPATTPNSENAAKSDKVTMNTQNSVRALDMIS